MKIQCLVTAPVGIVKQWAEQDEDGNSAKGPAALLPPGGVMPGTKKNKGREACHINFQGTYAELEEILHASMDIRGAQEFHLEHDEDGNVVGGVYQPIEAAFAAWMDDVVLETDENGNPISTRPAQPGDPLHHFSGSDPWVWDQSKRKR